VLWLGPVPAHGFRWRTKAACDLVPAYEQKLRACFAHAQVFFQASFSPSDDFLRLSAVDFRFTRLGSSLCLSEPTGFLRRSPIFPCFGSGATSAPVFGGFAQYFLSDLFCLPSSLLLLSSWPACRFRPKLHALCYRCSVV
jgi:hypothetical protein